MIFDCGWTKPTSHLPHNSAPIPRGRYADIPASFIRNVGYSQLRQGIDRVVVDQRVPETFSQPATHVVLTSCGVEEAAFESDGRGVFTRALLETLTAVATEDVSYEELIARLPVMSGWVPLSVPQNLLETLIHLPLDHHPQLFTRQKPHCEGVHQHCALFTSPAPSSRYTFKYAHSLIVRSSFGQIVLNAAMFVSRFGGSALAGEGERSICICIELSHGLEEVFDHLRDRLASDGMDTTTLDLSEPWPHAFDAYLRITNVQGYAVFDDLTSTQLEGPTSTARFGGFKRLPHTTKVDLDSLYPVICAVTNWYYHLLRTPPTRSLSGPGNITVDFTELEVVYDEIGNPSYLIPSGSNLSLTVPGLGNIVDLVVDEEQLYGQTVNNSSAVALYPYLFCFDNSDFSISTPPTFRTY